MQRERWHLQSTWKPRFERQKKGSSALPSRPWGQPIGMRPGVTCRHGPRQSPESDATIPEACDAPVVLMEAS